MNVAVTVSLITEIVTNLPAIVRSGREVIDLVNRGYKDLSEAIGDRDVTPEEINELVARIVANSNEIQSIE
jgi:hypothetical protein